MLWFLIFRRPVGFDPQTFQGPFLSALTFAQYLVPLAVLELCLRTKDHGGTAACIAMAIALLVLAGATGMGIVGATMGMWLPHM